jgi:hypothetical protein
MKRIVRDEQLPLYPRYIAGIWDKREIACQPHSVRHTYTRDVYEAHNLSVALPSADACKCSATDRRYSRHRNGGPRQAPGRQRAFIRGMVCSGAHQRPMGMRCRQWVGIGKGRLPRHDARQLQANFRTRLDGASERKRTRHRLRCEQSVRQWNCGLDGELMTIARH